MAAPTHHNSRPVENKSTRGATAVEYALILGLLVLALGAGLSEVGKTRSEPADGPAPTEEVQNRSHTSVSTSADG